MPSKRYRLLKDYPRAKAGTIVEEHHNPLVGAISCREFKISSCGVEGYFQVPLDVFNEWLEEVKEEVTFTKEQAQFMRDSLMRIDLAKQESDKSITGWFLNSEWLDEHTAKEE